MKTQLSIKLQKIVDLANNYSKEIFNQYLREQDQQQATKLCTLWGALDSRVRQVQEIIFITEFGQKWWDVVTQKERKAINYNYPNPLVEKAYRSVAHIVDKIMILAKKQIEDNSIIWFNQIALS